MLDGSAIPCRPGVAFDFNRVGGRAAPGSHDSAQRFFFAPGFFAAGFFAAGFFAAGLFAAGFFAAGFFAAGFADAWADALAGGLRGG